MTDGPTHTCPANSCTIDVPYTRLACPVHWRALPFSIRAGIMQGYALKSAGGSEAQHLAALERAVEWYRDNT